MSEPRDYRLYLEEKFGNIRHHLDGITTTMNSQFIDVNERLDTINEKVSKIEIQTTITNGRVNELEEQFINEKNRIDKEIAWGHSVVDNRHLACPNLAVILEAKQKTEDIHVDLEEYRMIKKYKGFFLIVLAVVVAGMLISAYASLKNVIATGEAKNLVERINEIEKKIQ